MSLLWSEVEGGHSWTMEEEGLVAVNVVEYGFERLGLVLLISRCH